MKKLLAAILASVIVASGSVIIANATAAGPTSLEFTSHLPSQGELDRLIGVFEQRLAEHETSLDARTLGGYYLQRGQLGASVEDYRKGFDAFETAARLAPTDVQAQLGLATAAASLHEFPTALALGEAVLQEEPTNAAAWLVVGDASLELGDLDGAAAAFVRLDPSEPATVVRMAEMAHLRGDQELAIEHAARATEIAEDRDVAGRPLVFYLLHEADLLFDNGQYEAADQRVQRALTIDPTWSVVHASRGKVLAALGDFAGATNAYRTALDLQPGDAGWLASLGDLRLRAGDVAMGHEAYEEAQAILQADTEVLTGRSLARLWSDLDINHAEAVRIATDDLERRADVLSYDTLAWALFRAGDYDEARVAADHATALGTRDGELLYHSAVIWAALGDTERAVAELESLLGQNPQFHPLHAPDAHAMLASLGGEVPSVAKPRHLWLQSMYLLYAG